MTTILVQEPWGDGEWSLDTRYGHMVTSSLFERYTKALEAVRAIEDEMRAAPFIDNRPPLTDDQMELVRRLIPPYTPLRNRIPRPR